MKALKCWTLADHSNRSVIVLHMQALEMFWWCKIDWWKQVVKVLTTDWDTQYWYIEGRRARRNTKKHNWIFHMCMLQDFAVTEIQW